MPSKKGSKQWLHPPEALTRGHILYTVKFLGECTVAQPKGTEVVKDAIRKMKFNKHIKRAEGIKSSKVNLTVSSEAVKVMDPKSRMCLHQYPLHRISYCADDKSDKRMFTFIAKDANSNQHYCYVFDSEKCAEEITLTIGQAFDLAYKQFLEVSNSDGDLRRQCVVLQKKVQILMYEKEALQRRLAQVEALKDRADIEEYKRNHQIDDISALTLTFKQGSTEEGTEEESVYDVPNNETKISQPSTVGTVGTVGRRLENLVLTDDMTEDRYSTAQNGRAVEAPRVPGVEALRSSGDMPILSPPPASSRASRQSPARTGNSAQFFPQSSPSTNPFSSPNPFASPSAVDPFGMEAFSPSAVGSGASAAGGSGQELLDMQAGFSQGLSFGADDFNLNDLDPLSKKL